MGKEHNYVGTVCVTVYSSETTLQILMKRCVCLVGLRGGRRLLQREFYIFLQHLKFQYLNTRSNRSYE